MLGEWHQDDCDLLDDTMLSLLSDELIPLYDATSPLIMPDSAPCSSIHASPPLVSVQCSGSVSHW